MYDDFGVYEIHFDPIKLVPAGHRGLHSSDFPNFENLSLLSDASQSEPPHSARPHPRATWRHCRLTIRFFTGLSDLSAGNPRVFFFHHRDAELLLPDPRGTTFTNSIALSLAESRRSFCQKPLGPLQNPRIGGVVVHNR